MFSDREYLDIMLGENHFNRNERDGSFNSNHAERSESALGDECENDDENRSLASRNFGTGIDAEYAGIRLAVILVQRSIDCRVS